MPNNTQSPDHALYLTTAGRRGCNRRVLWARSLSFGSLSVSSRPG